MALSDTNMRLNPESLILMNHTIVTSVKNSSREVSGSLRWKLAVLGGFGRSPDFARKSEISPASQIPVKIPANFSGQPVSSQNSSQIPAKIPTNFPRPARFQPKSQPIFPGQPDPSQNPSQFPRASQIPAKIPAKIPANFPGPARSQPKSQPIFPG